MMTLRLLALWLAFATAALAADLRIATLNCFLLFKPGIEHRGQLDNANPLTPGQYGEKIANLLTLVSGAQFIGLQETGGRAEIEDLAAAGGYQWAFAKGRDTYTGQEVGALYRLPGWKVIINGRVGALNAAVSKHLLVTARKDAQTIHFLVVHLIRPIGEQAAKHQHQLDCIAAWAREIIAREPASSVVILGDTNHPTSTPASSIYGIGQEAAPLHSPAATHLNGQSYDRLVLVGDGAWNSTQIRRPPYGRKPNKSLTRVWTDHFALEAVLSY
jgi:hypothetical protein